MISLDKNGSNIHMNKNENTQDIAQCYSISELVLLDSKPLSLMSFEVLVEEQSQGFVQFKKKLYKKGDEQRMLFQLIDISNQIMYEQVHAENEFLAITNATVSHELRNPL